MGNPLPRHRIAYVGGLRAIPVLLVVTFVATARGGTAPIAAPYVSPFVSSLPGRSFEETVVTQSAEPVNVTVARMPDNDVAFARASDWPGPHATLDPRYPVAFQAAFNYDGSMGNGFEHKIVIPPQRVGVYEIFLSSKERTAVQRLLVGTLGAIADFETSGSVILSIDTQTMRRRTDVSLTGYTNTEARVFRPGSDGLIHLPNTFWGTNLPNWPLGKLILTSSDGSILPMNYLGAVPSDPRIYLDTDRGAYRSGDRVHYELVTRQPMSSPEALALAGPSANFNQPVTLNARITTGTLMLPPDAGSGVYRLTLDRGLSAFSVADTRGSRNEILVRTVTPRVAIGEPVRFAVSVRTLRGGAAAGVRIAYAWHFLQYIRGPIPLAQALGMDPHLVRSETVTNGEGNATVTVPTPRDRATPVELVVYDPDTGAPIAVALARTDEPIPQSSGLSVSVSPSTITGAQNSFPVTARGRADGDALVRYGSPPNFQWRVVSFEHDVVRFELSPPSDEDSIPVSIMTASDSTSAPPVQLLIAKTGQPHHLRIVVGCYARDYRDGQPLRVCVRIRDWQNRPVSSNVTVTVTEATSADVAAAAGSGDAVYDRLYNPPAGIGIVYSSANTWQTNPPISYLYPETPRVPHFVGMAYALRRPGQYAPSGPELNLAPQTLYWLDQVSTEKNGELTLQLPWPVTASTGMYSIRVTAVGSQGEVGQALAFVRYHH